VELSYNITAEDIKAFLAHVNSRSWHARFWSIMWIWALILLVILVLVSILGDKGVITIGAWFLSVVLWLVFGRRWLRLFSGIILNRMIRGSNLGSSVGAQCLVVDKQGLCIYSDSGEARIHWSALQSVEHSDTHSYIMLSDVSGMVVPHSSIVAGDLQTVLTEIDACIRSAT
jgi:hypothetical protein